MTEQCTMYCRIKDCDSLEQRLSILEPTSIVFNEGKTWSKCTCTTKSGVVTISRKVFEKRGDDFARIRYTTVVEFESRLESNPDGAKRVVDHLEETQLLLGIVADPDFDSVKDLQKLLLNLAIEYDAMFFNGENMLDAFGSIVA